MQVTYELPHVFEPGSSRVENALALEQMLEFLIEINLAFLRRHTVTPLYRSGVVYGRTEIWDSIPALYLRRFGDCKSLTSALVAEYRHRGIQARPVFRFRPRRDLHTDYHILVQTPKGFEDPSKRLGMHGPWNTF